LDEFVDTKDEELTQEIMLDKTAMESFCQLLMVLQMVQTSSHNHTINLLPNSSQRYGFQLRGFLHALVLSPM
jgi:hypothetical protein